MHIQTEKHLSYYFCNMKYVWLIRAQLLIFKVFLKRIPGPGFNLTRDIPESAAKGRRYNIFLSLTLLIACFSVNYEKSLVCRVYNLLCRVYNLLCKKHYLL